VRIGRWLREDSQKQNRAWLQNPKGPQPKVMMAGTSNHIRSSADCITNTCESEFVVHTTADTAAIVRSMRHQDRQGRIGKDVAGGSAENHLPQSALGIGTLDQQVAL
jgi:hypothetical protein